MEPDRVTPPTSRSPVRRPRSRVLPPSRTRAVPPERVVPRRREPARAPALPRTRTLGLARTFGLVLALAVAAVLAPTVAGDLAAQRVDLTLDEGTNIAVALSPDGRTLAVDLLGGIWTLPAAGGRATRLTDELGDTRQPAWSPEGSRIAFQSYRDGNWHIWTVGADGTGLRQVTFGPYDDREPHWSPDGSRIAFSSDRSGRDGVGHAREGERVRGNYDIWEVDLATGGVWQVTQDLATEHSPAYSPSGDEIAFVSERGDSSRVLALHRSGRERRIAAVDGDAFSPAWTPDGRGVVYGVMDGGRSRLVLAGRTLTDDEDVFPFRAQWASAAEVLYTADGKIKRRRVDGGDATTVEFAARVAFDRPAYDRKRPDLTGSSPRRVKGIVAPRVSPDGRRVAVSALADLWVLPVDGTEPERLTDDPFVDRDPAWSPDGTRLAWISDRAGTSDLWVRDLRTGRDRRLTSLPTSEMGPTWSPDGSRIAFLTDEGEVLVVDADGGAVRPLHREDVAATLFRPGRPTWSPDGRTLAVGVLEPYADRYREGVSQVLMLSLDDGTTRRLEPARHLSIGKREDDGPVWSPDGSKLAFVMQGALWVLPVDRQGEPTGPLQRLTDEVADAPSWTGDSKHIVYLSSDRLRKVSLVDGRVTEIPVPLEWRRPEPAGRAVVHAGRLWDGTADRLRRDADVVIDGGRIVEVVDHSDARHDGARVVDASDRTVMPGLIEMHTHQRDYHGEALGRLWLAYGITSLREPASNPYRAVARREAVESGRRIGPRIFTTGYTLDGGRIYYSGALSLHAGPQVERELDRAAAMGFDVVKTYVRLPDVLQRRVVEGAHRRGMWVTSHELYPAVAFGADGVEHISGTSRRGYSPKVSRLDRSYGDVVGLLTASGMTITPTIAINGAFWAVAADDDALLDDPRFDALFPPPVVDGTRARLERSRDRVRAYERRLGHRGETIRRVVRGGGRVIAGTDAPIVPYGMSLHAEIEAYVRYGGLTPFEALRTATTWAAEALNASGELGSIEAGKLADLVVVRGDPLEDIRAARRVETVIRGGRVFTLDELMRRPAPVTAATEDGAR